MYLGLDEIRIRYIGKTRYKRRDTNRNRWKERGRYREKERWIDRIGKHRGGEG